VNQVSKRNCMDRVIFKHTQYTSRYLVYVSIVLINNFIIHWKRRRRPDSDIMIDLNEALRMDGKTVIVTGAASGIGSGIARFLSDVGAAVVIFDINLPQGEETAESIRDNGGKARFYLCDVTDARKVEQVVNDVVQDFDRIDCLVNCAGVIFRSNVLDLSENQWNLTMDVAVKGVFLVSKYVIRHMKENGGGKIINIGSGWSIKGGDRAVAYCAAKAAVLNMTRAMAIDHGKDNIAVNCVCPGDIDTPLLAIQSEQLGINDTKAFYDSQNDGRPLKGPGTPEDVARAVFFFLSGLSRWITGTSLVVDGGGLA
jgi:NAD(P)-dependent dehydrogenase (short-subunit alcohol dehydrogenase family)